MTVSRLNNMQSRFCEFLQYGRYEEEIIGMLRKPGSMQGVQRLDVYRKGYFIRLEKALAHNFPVTETVLGQEDFARLAGEYVLAHPSQHPSLRYAGSGFPAWLGGHGRAAEADLAAMEWAAMEVFDGPDIVAENVSCLDGLVPEDWAVLSISLSPTLRLLSLTSNADLVWIEKAEGAKLGESSLRFIAISRDYRSRPTITNLEPASFTVLNALESESRLAIVNERLALEQDPDNLPAHVANALHIAFANGWIAGVHINKQEKTE